MSAQSSKWREEQILILCPGSRTTMAQLGCHELTPPAYRIPTRMFRDEDSDEWRPYRTWKRRKMTVAAEDNGAATDKDEWEYVEDPDSDEGAVHPMEGGYITNMEAFLAFLEHVHGLLTTTYHNTPIVLMASPQWTRPDCEAIALYIFEKTRTPALCMINSALATQYGLKWPHMTVVDIGFEKVDVTCIYDSRIVNHMDIGYPAEPGEDRVISGGEVFTQRLVELLRRKDFTYEMAEQLKKSAICEVLPYAPDCPQLMELPEDEPGAALVMAPVVTIEPVVVGDGSLAVAADVDADLAMEDGVVAADNDGVLDVAAIVTTGQTKEFLAKKEKEKTERGRFGRRAKEKEAEAAKPVRLPNAKRARTIFHFEELIEDDEPPQQASHRGSGAGDGGAGGSGGAGGAAGSTNGKARDEDAEGSEDGSDAEGSEMDEDEDEDGEGEGEGEGEEGDGGAESREAAETKTEEKTAFVKPEDGVEAADKTTEAEAAGAAAITGEDATMADVAAASETTETKETKEVPAGETAETTQQATAVPSTLSTAAMAAVAAEQQGRRFKRLRRDLEIGLERFTFADRTEIDRIVATIYRTVQGIQDMYMRPSCWENLVFVGNGSRLRGLRENILQTLQSRHLISPSTATIFTSELPSHLGTPTGTGAQTPTGSGFLAPAAVSTSVNPLLQAATTASLGGPGSVTGADGSSHVHHFHAQTPTAIKTAVLPSYLSEWTKNGFEEAMFLGAQVAARLAFCVHNLDAQGLESQRLMYLSRIDYNELGPKGIRTHSLLG
ncbi:chromatin remodeling complex subunit [Grosmannia clavigera kw1407]|uniref:Chromatin remodeling complex subunit n=1 Tax=Grosmannia clavigera (strain kw1407 / UAMH 11150) TaxID=655863 RepID=F0XI43_GROCL|nr:chromatin remodeling complex subunit [Grosmannia clavigera kw1407]EFX03129.1 chromatin remodeling complex subunit [Grosmannia clavigera kw1407]